ncbi:hypothetical protein NFI96_031560, partial [Prochilodus magdalenae]
TGNQLTGPKEVKQCAGKPVHIVCRYHSFYRDNVKYWCKGYYFNFCTSLLRTDQPAHANGPLAIADNKKEGFFTIHIQNVAAEDSGWYWCAVRRVSRHVSISMELIISSERPPSLNTTPSTKSGASCGGFSSWDCVSSFSVSYCTFNCGADETEMDGERTEIQSPSALLETTTFYCCSLATEACLPHTPKEQLHPEGGVGVQLEHPHTVPADGAVGVEVEGHQVFWTCDNKPFILVLTTVPPDTASRVRFQACGVQAYSLQQHHPPKISNQEHQGGQKLAKD